MKLTLKLISTFFLATLTPCSYAAEQGALKDKTLVVWVARQTHLIG